MSRGNLCVAPPPGTSPIATSGWPKIALPTAAKHMSTASAISFPPPRARPSILAMVTLGMFLNRSPIICVRRKLRVWDTVLDAARNPAQTRVGYEEIRKCALQDHNTDALIGLELPAEFVEFLRQNLIKKIYRRVIDADECDSGIER